MTAEMLERDDLSVYVVAGMPKSFKRRLQEVVRTEAKDPETAGVVQMDEQMASWVVAKLLDEKRPKGKRTPASRALWRAFTALSAARYHLQHTAGDEGDRVRELRMQVEELWRQVSPMFDEHGGPLPDPVPEDDDDD